MGFDAGDSNLYRYVNNAPTDHTDPSGEISIYFEGGGIPEGDQTILNIMSKQDPGDTKRYVFGLASPNLVDDVKDAVALIEKATKKAKDDGKTEPVYIYGWSRGGTAAMLTVRALKQKEIPVDYLGLIDPNVAGAGTLKNTSQFIVPKSDAPIPERDLTWSGLPTGNPPGLLSKYNAVIPSNVKAADVFYTLGRSDTIVKAQLDRELANLRITRIVYETKNEKAANVTIHTTSDIGHMNGGYSAEIGTMLRDNAMKAGAKFNADGWPANWGQKPQSTWKEKEMLGLNPTSTPSP